MIGEYILCSSILGILTIMQTHACCDRQLVNGTSWLVTLLCIAILMRLAIATVMKVYGGQITDFISLSLQLSFNYTTILRAVKVSVT